MCRCSYRYIQNTNKGTARKDNHSRTYKTSYITMTKRGGCAKTISAGPSHGKSVQQMPGESTTKSCRPYVAQCIFCDFNICLQGDKPYHTRRGVVTGLVGTLSVCSKLSCVDFGFYYCQHPRHCRNRTLTPTIPLNTPSA